MNKGFKILLAQRASANFYPPVINQAALLCRENRVTLLDTCEEASSLLGLPSGVQQVQIGVGTANSPLNRRLALLQSLWRYAGEFGRQMRRRPDAVIAYDMDAAYLLLRRATPGKGPLKIVHFHEYPEQAQYFGSYFGLFAWNYVRRHLRRADLVVMPDKHRAMLVQGMFGLPETPLVVMNCPRRLSELPQSRLLPLLRERGLPLSQVVHYQGSVAPDHNFERLIESMRFWPGEAVLSVVGRGNEDYINGLRRLSREVGVEERVVFVGRVPYEQVFSYAVGAAIGVNFLEGRYLQWKYSAGASNKRFEYVALGIPQLTNDLPGVRELFVQTGVARTAPYDNAEGIGRAVAAYLEDLEDDQTRRAVHEQARALHLEWFNYEEQIKPLEEFIASRCSSKRKG